MVDEIAADAPINGLSRIAGSKRAISGDPDVERSTKIVRVETLATLEH